MIEFLVFFLNYRALCNYMHDFSCIVWITIATATLTNRTQHMCDGKADIGGQLIILCQQHINISILVDGSNKYCGIPMACFLCSYSSMNMMWLDIYETSLFSVIHDWWRSDDVKFSAVLLRIDLSLNSLIYIQNMPNLWSLWWALCTEYIFRRLEYRIHGHRHCTGRLVPWINDWFTTMNFGVLMAEWSSSIARQF